MLPFDLKSLTLGEVEKAGYTTAVLPLGATEPHNYHLPYGTDNFQVDRIAADAVGLANEKGGRCVLLPGLPFGYDGNVRGFPLAISLQPSTIIQVVGDVAASLVESGLDYLFLLNGHGGNEIKTIIRELYTELDLFICGTDWWQVAADVTAREAPATGDHANQLETSVCLHVVPELVKMKQATDGRMREPAIEEFKQGWVKFSRPWKSFAPTSGAGDPRQATAEAGERIAQAAAERIGEFLRKLSISPRREGFPYTP